jgi:hypothetical protein
MLITVLGMVHLLMLYLQVSNLFLLLLLLLKGIHIHRLITGFAEKTGLVLGKDFLDELDIESPLNFVLTQCDIIAIQPTIKQMGIVYEAEACALFLKYVFTQLNECCIHSCPPYLQI